MGLLENMIYQGASKEELKEAIHCMEVVRDANKKLEEFDDKYLVKNPKRVSYKNYYTDTIKKQSNRPPIIDDIIFDNLNDAENVLNKMSELIDMYGVVSIADLRDLSGVDRSSIEDNDFVWTNLNDAHVVRLKENQYYIKFPNPRLLN